MVLRCEPDEWLAISKMLPDNCVNSIMLVLPGCESPTGEVVPEGFLHVVMPLLPEIVHVLERHGWTTEDSVGGV
jgi:hypothetical protein